MTNEIKLITALIIILILITGGLVYIINQPILAEENKPKQFSSLEELKSFVKNNTESYQSYGYALFAGRGTQVTATAKESAAEYSKTNIQVEDVDEPDIVKNDGKYIYTISGKKIILLDAFPAENMKTLATIEFNQTPIEIFINEDKLIVFLQSYETIAFAESSIPRSYSSTDIIIYNIKNRENPVQEANFSIEGNYFNARMIDSYIYVISSKYINIDNPIPPIYSVSGIEKQTQLGDIYYFDFPDYSYIFSTIASINIDTNDFKSKVFLTGATNNLYVSQANIYLAHEKITGYKDFLESMIKEAIIPILPPEEKTKAKKILDSDKPAYQKFQEIGDLIQSYSNSLSGKDREEFDDSLEKSLSKFSLKFSKENEKTLIHKINIDKENIEYKTSGEVPGKILNQFSMDEHKGYFRIATTTGDLFEGTSLNHLFILDENMKLVGSVEDLAPGERIYSARFIGDKAYIVTFKKIDPFFVIDLSNPNSPKVLGYLKIPGYSDYLQAYDENHIIGIGKGATGGTEQFAWYQGVKVSIFDVSNFENPKETAKLDIGTRGTDSYALRDHKAILFDKKRNLLVIPILLAEINKSKYQDPIPDYAYGDPVWQGAYVLDISPESISLKGKITHFDNFTNISRHSYYNDQYQVKRSLFMDNTLYTISSDKVKANSLETIEEISSVTLPYQNPYPYQRDY